MAAYIKIYQGEELPEPKSMLQATAEANNLAAVSNCKAFYNKIMEELCGGDKPFLNPESLQIEHNRCLERTLEMFHSTRKMGGPEFSQAFEEQLKIDIEQAFESFVKHNESKNIFSAARTPAVLFTFMVAAYMISGLLGLLGLETLANLVNLVMFLFLILLVTWLYVRYSGEHRNLAVSIDQLADLLWDNVLSQAYAKVAEKGMQQALQSQGLPTTSSTGSKKKN